MGVTTDSIEQLVKSRGVKMSLIVGETKEGQLFCLVDTDKSTREHVIDLRILQKDIKPLRDILQQYAAIAEALDELDRRIDENSKNESI